MALVAIPFGLAIGVALGMLGGGGSVLAVPVLVYLLGQDVETATTTSLVVVTAAALAGGAGHVLDGRVCWRHAATLTSAAVPALVAGTVLGGALGGTALLIGFAGVMMVAAAGTWARAADPPSDPVRGGRHGALRPATTRRPDGREPAGRAGSGAARRPAPSAGGCPALSLGRDAGTGVLVGFLTGFFGVGGGFVVVPALVVGLAFSMRAAIGTSLAIIAITSVLGVAVHLAAGRMLDPALTAVLAAACVAGALFGARLSGRVPQQSLGRAFAGLVLLVAGWLLVSAAFLGGPPS